MIRPERRTRGDLIAAAAIAAVVLLVIATFWWHSSERATISRPATGPAPSSTAADAVPPTLAQRWTAASGRTLSPILVGATVITGDGATMAGLDPQDPPFDRDPAHCLIRRSEAVDTTTDTDR